MLDRKRRKIWRLATRRGEGGHYQLLAFPWLTQNAERR